MPIIASDRLDALRPCEGPVPGFLAESLLDALEDVLWSVAPDGRLLFLGRSAETLLGHPAAAFFENAGLWRSLVDFEDRSRLRAVGPERHAGPYGELEYRILRPDGRRLWLRDRAHPIRNAAGAIIRVDGLVCDISETKFREQRLQRLNRLQGMLTEFQFAASRIHDRDTLFATVCQLLVERGHLAAAWVGTAGEDGQTITGAAQASTETSASDLLPARSLVCPPESPLIRGVGGPPHFCCNDLESVPELAAWCRDKTPWRALVSLPLRAEERLKGCLFLAATETGSFSAEELNLFASLAYELAQALVQIENEEWLNYRVMYDNLTGLANRTLFVDRLAQLIHRRSPFTVLVFDVDRFKYINENLTYQAGDFLLQQLGMRLVELAPEIDLARPGGDDFALILADIHTEFEIARFVREQLLPATSRPVLYEGEELRVSLKIGAACFPEDGTDAHTLLANAETAHRGAQNSNENLLFFGETMNRGIGDFFRMETRLRRAAERHEFLAYYQPKIDLRLGRMYGVEALLRWNDPDEGIILPGRFIRVLEETGVILGVGRWMLEEAGRQFLRWAELDPAPPHIAVNISPQHLSQRDFIADVEAAVAICRNHPGYLELEITESSIMYDIEENIRKLHAVREMGVEISMDDFGTGYSSLSYLTRLPLTRLKIDQSFIAGMTESADSLAIVSSIISLAHTLDLKVAAEGVETEEQLKFLKLLRCDEIQGFLFGEPVEAGSILRYKRCQW